MTTNPQNPQQPPKGDADQLFVSVGVKPNENGKWTAALFVHGIDTKDEATKMAEALRVVCEQHFKTKLKLSN